MTSLSSLVIFRPPAECAHEGHDLTLLAQNPDYISHREQSEREAARNSSTFAARCIHEELADRYARLKPSA